MSKYIDADAVDKIICKKIENTVSCAEHNALIDVKFDVEELSAADVEPVRKWILCSEQMPEMDEDVLTCDKFGFITISSCNGAGEFSCYADDYYIGHSKKPKVVAWMPLPEAPKMDGGSE